MYQALLPLFIVCLGTRLLRSARSHAGASCGSVISLLPNPPCHAHTAVTSLFFFSTERIDASYFKAPLATSKSRQTTSEDAWALFISRCRYADEYSNQFNIFFAIVDIKCVQIYNKFEAKGIYTLPPPSTPTLQLDHFKFDGFGPVVISFQDSIIHFQDHILCSSKSLVGFQPDHILPLRK